MSSTQTSAVETADLAPPPPANGGDYARLKALFNAVCDLPDEAAQRAALAGQGVDAATLDRVLALLGHGAAPTRFAAPVAAAAARWLDQELSPGDRLGAWTLEHEMGRGGMGRVFAARRSDGHYEQRAAIKVLLGYTGPDSQQRLMRERQILARLEHPNIARLLDGGTTPAGRPYLVMEFADGEPIDRHAQARHLDLPARLDLFDEVCEALAYAHRHLVIHCDIKPGNVLVDVDGRVRLIDFGISRLEGDGQDLAPAMTPGYASPEQQAGQAPGVPSDIYSLGRLLGELVAPARGKQRWRELDAIVGKATAPDPAARYDSVAALQLDLQRVRAHQPVQAMPQTVAYVTGKLLRRRWPWALAGTAALLMAAGFTVRVVQERNEAQFQRQQAEGLIEFMLGDLNNKLRQANRTDILEAAQDRAMTYFESLPRAGVSEQALRLRAKAMINIGNVRLDRGSIPAAAEAYRAAAEIAAQLAEAAPADVDRQVAYAEVLAYLGMVAWMQGDLAQAEQQFLAAQRILVTARSAAPADLRGVRPLISVEGNLGQVFAATGRLDEAAAHFREMLALAQALLAGDPGNPDLAAELGLAHSNLGKVALEQGDLRGAIVQYEADAAVKARFVSRYPKNNDLRERLVEARIILGRTLALSGQVERGAGELREALAEAERLVALDPSMDLFREYAGSAARHLARLALGQRDAAQARPLYERALATFDRLTERDPTNIFWRQELAEVRLGLADAALAAGDPRVAQVGVNAALAGLEPLLAQRPQDRSLLLATLQARLRLAAVGADPQRAAALRQQVLADIAAQRAGQRDPRLLALRLDALLATGRPADAQLVLRALWQTGYRDPSFFALLARNAIAAPPEPPP
jgi:tetratricopeptide (TPR) repeat protein